MRYIFYGLCTPVNKELALIGYQHVFCHKLIDTDTFRWLHGHVLQVHLPVHRRLPVVRAVLDQNLPTTIITQYIRLSRGPVLAINCSAVSKYLFKRFCGRLLSAIATINEILQNLGERERLTLNRLGSPTCKLHTKPWLHA